MTNQQCKEILERFSKNSESEEIKQIVSAFVSLIDKYEELKETIENNTWKIKHQKNKLKRYEEVYLAHCDKGLLHSNLKLRAQLHQKPTRKCPYCKADLTKEPLGNPDKGYGGKIEC